jgi:hypothetical protein
LEDAGIPPAALVIYLFYSYKYSYLGIVGYGTGYELVINLGDACAPQFRISIVV